MIGVDHRQALGLILSALERESPALHRVAIEAIDAGKDVPDGKAGRGRRRGGSRIEKLTDEEAIAVTLNVLQSFFVELPKLQQSIEKNFRLASLEGGDGGKVNWTASKDGRQSPVLIEFEQRTAQKFSASVEVWTLEAPSDGLIAEQEKNLDEVVRLVGVERRLPWQR